MRRNPEKLKVLIVGLLDRQFRRLRAPKWVQLRLVSSQQRSPVITSTNDVTILNARFLSHSMIDQALRSSIEVIQVHGGVTQIQMAIDAVVGRVVREGGA
jgi:hypothetical protein